MGKTLLVVAGVVAYQGGLHWLTSRHGPGPLSAGFAVAPLVLGLAWFAVEQRRRPLFCAMSIAALCLLVLMAWRMPENSVWIPQVTVYLALLVFFGRSLRPGVEPVVTRIARQTHGSLPPEIERYARQTTIAWCLFFVFMALTSGLLFNFAPRALWSFFANVLNLPLVILMFAVEYSYRIRRFPDFEHVSLLETIRAVIRHQSSESQVAKVR